ncbi:MAG: ion transporter [candidate division Zixibacteria bacterium]
MAKLINRLRIRIYQILEVAKKGDRASSVFDYLLVLLISFNVIAVILESEKSISDSYSTFFNLFELVSVIVFTIEYILRVWTCTFNNRYKLTLWGRLKFILSPLALIDLLAILPFYIPMLISIDLRFLRVLRLIRIFRLFKIARYSETIRTFGIVLKSKKEDLFITVFAVILLLIISSSLMYFFEYEAQPMEFSSIFAAMWWGIATLTTVGYGDIYPVTVAGKITGAFVALFGIGLFALPAGILGSGFIEEIQNRKNNTNVCPHCNKTINK